MTNDLPCGWVQATFGDIADVQLGRQRSPQHHSGSHMRPYLRAANVTWNGVSLDDVKEMNFDDRDFETYRLEPGDLLLNEASGSPSEVGKPAIWRGEIEDCCFQNTLLRLRPRGIDVGYLYWYCFYSALTGRFGEAGRGVNIRHIGKRGLTRFPIAVAPRVEQERIVAAIEEHFSRLDAAENALASAQRKVAAVLRAVVDEACCGSWDAVPLVEVITSLRNGVFVSRPAPGPPGRPIYRISAVRPLRLRINDVRYAHPEPQRADDYAVASGDLLFTRYSGNPSYVGAAAVVNEAGHGVLHPDKLIRVVADKTRVLPEWIAAYVSVGEGRRQVEQRSKTTAGQIGISGHQLKSVPIAVPPLDYQRWAAASISAVMACQDRTEQDLAKLRDKMSALRRSILASAFAGQLIRQDPDDESVFVLS